MGIKRFLLLLATFLSLFSCAKDIVDLTGSVYGIVKDYSTGQIIENCRVSISPGGKSTLTSSSGTFVFENLEPGTYTISFNKSEYLDESQEIVIITGQVTSLSVMLKASSSQKGGIKGTVKDYNGGQALANCNISLTPGGKSVTSSSSGAYDFSDLAPGDYTVTFSKSGYYDESKNVSVKAGSIITADVLLKAKSSFSVSETNYDFGDFESSKTFYLFNYSDQDCSYKITNVPNWLSFNHISGIVSPSGNDEVTATVDRSKVGEGQYEQSITITYSGKSSGVVTVSIKMTKVVLRAPSVSIANQATNIQNNSFDIVGTITATGGSQILSYGHCWSTSGTPSINNSKTDLGVTNSIGSYSSTASNLSTNTTYYVRAYARNAQGVSYSNVITVTTQDNQSDKWDGTKASSFAGGSGTYADPYIIKTGSQLVLMKDYSGKSGIHFALCNDINLNNNSWPEIQLGSNSSFDGQGFTVYNLKISRSADNLGFFAKNSGSIKNLTINGVDIRSSSSKNVGALVGYLHEGAITNCHIVLNGNSMIQAGSNVGGIVGFYEYGKTNNTTILSNCSVASSSSSFVLMANNTVGGLIGYDHPNYTSIIADCHVNVNIKGEYDVGGIIGNSNCNYGPDTVRNCSYKGSINGNSKLGGIVGRNSGSSGPNIVACKVDAKIGVNDNYAGGFCGYDAIGAVNIKGSYTTGTIECNNSGAQFLGGFMGYTKSSINYHATLCYSTMTSQSSSFGGFCASDCSFRGKDCAAVCKDKHSGLSNCNSSCTNITEFLQSCYSTYADCFNFNKTWTWSGAIDGVNKTVSCPRLSWE